MHQTEMGGGVLHSRRHQPREHPCTSFLGLERQLLAGEYASEEAHMSRVLGSKPRKDRAMAGLSGLDDALEPGECLDEAASLDQPVPDVHSMRDDRIAGNYR